MGKPSISIGDDTPSGEPDDGPRGPYITDEDDGSPDRKSKLPGNDAGAQPPKSGDPTKRPRAS